MAKYTITIGDILKSYYEDGLAYRTKEELQYGDYLSSEEIIKNANDSFWKHVNINEYVTKDFQYLFLARFYNCEIGFETVQPFYQRLGVLLNTDVYLLLRLAEELRQMAIDDMINEVDMWSHGNTTGDAKEKASNIDLVESTPETDKGVVFNFKDDANFSIIEYANQIGENHSKGDRHQTEDRHNHTKGYQSGVPLYILMQSLTQMVDPYSQIFNILEPKLFMQLI